VLWTHPLLLSGVNLGIYQWDKIFSHGANQSLDSPHWTPLDIHRVSLLHARKTVARSRCKACWLPPVTCWAFRHKLILCNAFRDEEVGCFLPLYLKVLSHLMWWFCNDSNILKECLFRVVRISTSGCKAVFNRRFVFSLQYSLPGQQEFAFRLFVGMFRNEAKTHVIATVKTVKQFCICTILRRLKLTRDPLYTIFWRRLGVHCSRWKHCSISLLPSQNLLFFPRSTPRRIGFTQLDEIRS